MAAWQAFLLGLVQGITEFLPISSSGHVVLLEHLLGIELNNRILFGALLHIGTLIPVILVFKRDIKRLFWGMIHIFVDLIKNFTIWFHNKKHRDDVRYRKILSTNYRKFTVLILISLIPTAVIGYILQKMASRAFDNLLAPAIGFFYYCNSSAGNRSCIKSGGKITERYQVSRCCDYWSVSGIFCISGSFTCRRNLVCRIFVWIFSKICDQIFLYYDDPNCFGSNRCRTSK